jgi:type II restriction/modification system DNA methylase subunit YeeA
MEGRRPARGERSLLRKLLTRISKIRVFDPACGSGNFPIIAYRELRTLEMRIFKRPRRDRWRPDHVAQAAA